MMSLLTALVLSLGIAMGSGCSVSQKSNVVARVNGKNISARSFEDRLNEYRVGPHSALMASPQNMELKKRVLNELIEEKVMLEEAEKQNIEVAPQDLEERMNVIQKDYPKGSFEKQLAQEKISLSRFRERIKLNILMEKVIEKVTENIPTPSAKDIELYYNEHQDEFSHEAQVHLKQIVVKTEEDGERILTELKKGVPFDVLAQNHSFTPEAAQGGDLGWVSVDILPEPIQKALPKLKKNHTSDVISTDYGFHIVTLLERKKPEKLTLEEATPLITPILTQKDREEKFAAWRRSILSKAKIERNHGLLAKIN